MTKDNEQMNDTVNETAQTTVDNYRYICTMDITTFEGKRAIVNARNNALSLNNIGDTPLTVIGAYVGPGVRSQTGQKCVNVYLLQMTVIRISASRRAFIVACWIFMTCSLISTRRTVSP